MNRLLSAILLVLPGCAWGQTTSVKVAALNNYAAYANKSAEEVNAVFASILDYYPKVKYFQQKKSYQPRYECRTTPEEYYFNKAVSEGKLLADAAILNAAVGALREAAGVIDSKCKALDTYHKLEDYKRDNFSQAEVLVNELQKSLVNYRLKQSQLASLLEASWQKLIGTLGPGAYLTIDQMMKKEISRERAFLDLWSYNLNDAVHTDWPVEQLQASTLQTDQAVGLFSRTKPTIEYPASSMIGSFTEALGSVLSAKRSGLDGNNYDAKQSDKHSNEVYLELINYFNGQLVADHNTFINFSVSNSYPGLASIDYVPLYEIRSVVQQETIVVKPFQDIPAAAFTLVVQAAPISLTMANTLDNYIEFINESTRNINNLIQVLRNFNSDAEGYKDLRSYKGKGGLRYQYENFKIPLSMYDAAISRTKGMSQGWVKSINDQALVLLAILKEMDQLSASLQEDAARRSYEKDNLAKAYGILERYQLLIDVWDLKKEHLYFDLRRISESYPQASPTGSWAKSQRALVKLLDEDRLQLAKMKAQIKGDVTSIPSTAIIDQLVREILSNEFANMKGIPQLGRSNGNDPYTPYEEIPATSRSLSEKLQNKNKHSMDEYMGPYHPYVNYYNDVVDYYNKFCGLAAVSILRAARQTEYFSVEYPEKKEKEADTFPELPQAPPPVSSGNPTSDEEQRSSQTAVGGGRVIHDTIKVTDIIRIETRQKDTVYIEKHDTIYREKPGEKLMSLDGYATNNLVFLLDVSGSMNTGQKLPVLKKSMLLLSKILREEDHVSIVVYSGKARIILPPTSGREQEKISKVIESLKSDGETDGNAGIRLAYKTADGNYIRGGNNRIVLATDGEFKVSTETLALISRYSGQDIFLSVFNFGQTTAASVTLQKLSDLGKGNYENITRQNSDVTLITEAKGKKK